MDRMERKDGMGEREKLPTFGKVGNFARRPANAPAAESRRLACIGAFPLQ